VYDSCRVFSGSTLITVMAVKCLGIEVDLLICWAVIVVQLCSTIVVQLRSTIVVLLRTTIVVQLRSTIVVQLRSTIVVQLCSTIVVQLCSTIVLKLFAWPLLYCNSCVDAQFVFLQDLQEKFDALSEQCRKYRKQIKLLAKKLKDAGGKVKFLSCVTL
jgi:hypothetical protein